jgi:hypothetical protein
MSGIIPVEDPQFANARGFYHYGKQILVNWTKYPKRKLRKKLKWTNDISW